MRRAGSNGISRLRGQRARDGRRIESGLRGGHEQRGLGRIAGEAEPVRRRHRGRVVDDGGRGEEQRQVGVARKGDVGAALDEVPARSVAAALDVHDAPVGYEPHHRHAILGHRSGLVRADHRRGAERLHGGQPADEGTAPGQAPETGGERHGRDGRQPLGDGGHREADGGLEHQPDRLPVQDAREPHRAAHREREPDEAPAQRLDLALERGRPRAGEGHELTDAAELGREARGRHHREPAPGERGRRQVDHRAPLGERRVGIEDGLRVLVDRIALAGQGRFAHAERGAPDQAGVGGHPDAGLEHDEIARDQLGARDLRHQAAPAHERARHGEGPQPGHRDPRPPLGGEADRGVEDEGGQDGQGFHALAQDPGDECSGEQQQHDEAPELGEREPPERSLRMIAHAIGTDPRQSLPRLAGGEPGIEVGAEVRGDRREVECVPGLTDDGGLRASQSHRCRLIAPTIPARMKETSSVPSSRSAAGLTYTVLRGAASSFRWHSTQ